MKTLMTCAMALVVVTLTSNLVSAQETNDAAKKDRTKVEKKKDSKPDPTRVSEEGFAAMRAMHGARLAIFNGKPDDANKAMQAAMKSLTAAAKDEAAAKDKTDLVAIDGTLALADTFVPSAKKAEHVAKANEHFKNGDKSEGIKQLRLGEIEVTFSRVLMPLGATKKRLDDAMKLAKEHKYYEANLALKAAEEGLVYDSISLIEFPGSARTNAKSTNAGDKANGDKGKKKSK